jgi:hypothetical protein
VSQHREWQRQGAAEQRYSEVTPSQLTGMHPLPLSQSDSITYWRGSGQGPAPLRDVGPPNDWLESRVRISLGGRGAPYRRIDPKPDLKSTLKCIGGNSGEVPKHKTGREQMQQNSSFDHVVSTAEQRGRHVNLKTAKALDLTIMLMVSI